MASSLETNKLLASILTAGIIASGTGVLSRMLYHPTAPEETAYAVAVEAAEGEGEGEAGGAPAGQPIGVLLASASPEEGEGVARKCTSCHSFEAGGGNKIGPALHNVVGRDIASVPDFAYSDSLAEKEGSWDYEALNAFLLNPKQYAPGTKMAFAGVAADDDRADLIMYLHSISENPPPLPEASAGEGAVAASEAAPAAGEEAGEQMEAREQMAAAEPQLQSAEAQPTGSQEQQAVATQDTQQGTATSREQPPQAAPQQATGGQPQPAETQVAQTQAAAGAAGGDSGIATMIANADPAAGEKAARKCAACHSFEQGGPNKIGPGLHGVVGRDVASVEGFTYSDALTSKEGAWDYQALDAFLADPKGWAPGTKMAFAGVKKEQERAEIIAYLRSITENPPPLPEG